MKKVWIALGVGAFWLSWPLLFLYLGRSRRAKVLVVSGNQLLTLKVWLSAGRWSLPGGGLHKNEDPKTGALRELYEETGISAQPKELQPLLSAIYKEDGLSYQYECYSLELPEPTAPKPSHPEILEAVWQDKEQLLKSRISQEMVSALKAYFVIQ